MTKPTAASPYRVLARKYRPQSFAELIGQDAMVTTLGNAIERGRIAHAFLLTGVRGVGKTTTARIIAKALNYTGPDGKAGPTTESTDDCPQCQSIAEGRHPDIMEMDAASRTGVDDIREILDGVRYAPTSARYKIYIIDEVHMLSKGAFNALLKTLEEPPPHVKFIFATTEIRKVPVTVLSRCQRFDLRRVEIPVLEGHYTSICQQEKVPCEAPAIAMISRAADGSVRDGLSLLDQAMALGAAEGVTAALVQDMLGLADRGRILDLLDHALKGNVTEALAVMDDLHRLGADASVIVNDLLELTHLMTRLRIAPKTKDMTAGLSPDGIERAADLAGKLSMPSLGRAWQILLKGVGEVNAAPNPQSAAEMVLIRLIYAADLPDPADLLKRLKDQGATNAQGSGAQSSPASRIPEPVALRAVSGSSSVAVATPAAAPLSNVAVASLQDVVSLLEQQREVLLANNIFQYAHLVKFQQGHIELRVEPEAHPKLAQDVGKILTTLTGQRWMLSVSGAPGEPTLAQRTKAAYEARLDVARENPVVAEVLKLFPGAKLDLKTNE
ncbi:MAG: DNA polymerase III subunit gamma/tau [Micavibrio sp.]